VAAYCGIARFNATKAYELAGYATRGSAGRREASKLLAKPRVAEAISDRFARLVERLSIMGGDEALEHLTVIARADIGKVLDPDDPIAKLPDDVRATIKAVRPNRYGRVIELHDSMRAAELLAKAAGRLAKRHEHRVRVGLLDLLVPETDEQIAEVKRKGLLQEARSAAEKGG
jgi:ADP-heptose:LPS heptosyltransferase